MQYPGGKLIIFARAPEPGQVKTRLIPALGQQGAADFYRRMAQSIINSMLDAQLCDVAVECLPDSRHGFFMDLLNSRCVELNRQTGSDLGERMAGALRTALGQYQHAIIIGTDAPCLQPAYIQAAMEKLVSGVDVVIGPAEDGGYVLIGMSQLQPGLFTDIDWGTDQVLSQTLEKAEQLGLSVYQLPTLWDVDMPDDLHRVEQDPKLKSLLNELEYKHEPENT